MSFGDYLRNLRLPFSAISGAVLWALQLLIGYVLATQACRTNSGLIILVLGIIAAIPTIGMALIAYRGWRRSSDQQGGQPDIADTDGTSGLMEFFGSAGTLVSTLFLLLIAATALYGFFLSPCPIITMPMP